LLIVTNKIISDFNINKTTNRTSVKHYVSINSYSIIRLFTLSARRQSDDAVRFTDIGYLVYIEIG